MIGEANLAQLVQGMTPKLNKGTYVFCTLKNTHTFDWDAVICTFKETEGTTVVLAKEKADEYQLHYEYVAAWITLLIHSSLEAVGFTAAVSAALAEHHISCNVVAAYHHDHLFVATKDAEKAVKVLTDLSKKYKE